MIIPLKCGRGSWGCHPLQARIRPQRERIGRHALSEVISQLRRVTIDAGGQITAVVVPTTYQKDFDTEGPALGGRGRDQEYKNDDQRSCMNHRPSVMTAIGRKVVHRRELIRDDRSLRTLHAPPERTFAVLGDIGDGLHEHLRCKNMDRSQTFGHCSEEKGCKAATGWDKKYMK